MSAQACTTPAARLLTCLRCKQQFPYAGHGRPATWCSTRCAIELRTPTRPAPEPRPAARVITLPLDPERACLEPRRGDLIRSGEEYRLVVARAECVVYKVLLQPEEHTVTLERWRGWCEARNASAETAIQLVSSRRAAA
jgi:hypothetical protein